MLRKCPNSNAVSLSYLMVRAPERLDLQQRVHLGLHRQTVACIQVSDQRWFLTCSRNINWFKKKKRSSGSPPFFPNRPDTKRQYPTDLLVDGFIARTFASEDADRYLKLLLQEQNFLQYYGILHHRCVWLITHNFDLMQGTSPGVQYENYPLLDYSVTDSHNDAANIRWARKSARANCSISSVERAWTHRV